MTGAPPQRLTPTLRQRLGCWLHERSRAELVLRAPRLAAAFGVGWLDLRNRGDAIVADDRTGGRDCLWQDSSPLTVGRVFPAVATRLLRHLLAEWPICMADAATPVDATSEETTGVPDVSFLVGIRGTARRPQFEACLASLHGQTGVAHEIVVVEQSDEPELAALGSRGVRYVPTGGNGQAYNRSWALNVAARAARGRLLVILDGDMLLPSRFAAACADVMDRSGLRALRPARFLAYLDPVASAAVQSQRTMEAAQVAATDRPVEMIVQNISNPLVVCRETYLSLGGHDERFVGWGGEDNEFIDRLRTVDYSEGGFLPVVHLWHASAISANPHRNRSLLESRLAIPADARIAELAAAPFGRVDGPVPPASPRDAEPVLPRAGQPA